MRKRTFSNVVAAVATSSLVAASPSLPKHHHHRAHQLEARDAASIDTVNVPGPTQIVYEYNGDQISQEAVCRGIQDGTLKWAAGTEEVPPCPLKSGLPPTPPPHPLTITPSQPLAHSTAATFASVAVEKGHNSGGSKQLPTITSESSIVSALWTPQTALPWEQSQSDAMRKVESTTTTTQIQSLSAAETPVPQSLPYSSSSSPLYAIGINRDFDDGLLDCSNFPDTYGPIRVDWAGLGGWSGIQYVTIEGNVITHIDTAIPSRSEDLCKPGAMCSYACPPGFQKSQWPSAQGQTGESVGGLRCDENGKLRLTNRDLSSKLCVPGTGSTVVRNTLSDNAAICRTDYPGTENMVVPLDTQPGLTSPLTCPDARSYFRHEGSSTTAQYYINNQGVPLEKACIWNSAGSHMGNWAPSFLGVGEDISGRTYLAIASTAQKDATDYIPLNYSIEITGDISGRCKLVDGLYCSGDDYETCNDYGCTVSLLATRQLIAHSHFCRWSYYQDWEPTFCQTSHLRQ